MVDLSDILVKALGAIATVAGAVTAWIKFAQAKSWKFGNRTWKPGDRIEVLNSRDGQWYAASVESMLKDRRLEVKHGNARIELIGTRESDRVRPGRKIRDVVEVLDNNDGQWYTAHIIAFARDGGYKVRFEDDEVWDEDLKNIRDKAPS